MANHNYRDDDALNQLNDNDEVWGPLLFLRPASHRRILGIPRALAISTMVGSVAGMLGNLAFALLQNAASRRLPHVALLPLIMTTIAFACCQLTFAGAWNRRARRLAHCPEAGTRDRVADVWPPLK